MNKQTRILWTRRDVEALRWIAEQYAIRLDQLQVLLGRLSDRPIGQSTVYAVLARWRKAGWVETQKVLAGEPVWVSVTRQAMRSLGFRYHCKAILKSETRFLAQIGAINAVRLQLDKDGMEWVSRRQLLLEGRGGGRVLPDAELYRPDGTSVAIKVGFSAHPARCQHLRALLQAEDRFGDPYHVIWCPAADPSVLLQIRDRCAGVPELQMVVEEEACRIVIKGRTRPEPEQAPMPRSGRRRSRRMGTQRTPVATWEDEELTSIFKAVAYGGG